MNSSLLANSYRLLSNFHKKKSISIVLMLSFISALDFLSIASFLPIIFLTVDGTNVGWMIPEILQSYPQQSIIISVTLAFLMFMIIKNLLIVYMSRVRGEFVFGISADLSNRAIESHLSNGYPSFVNTDVGQQINRISNQPLVFANNIILPFCNILSEILVAALILACISWYDWRILITLIAILTPAFFLYRVLRKKINATGDELKNKYPLSAKYALQATEGFVEIKSYGKQAYFMERFKAVMADLRSTFVRDHIVQAGATRLTEVIAALIVCVLVIYSVIAGMSYSKTILLLSLYASASFRLIPSVNRILQASLQIKTHGYVVDELMPLRQGSRVETGKTIAAFQERIEIRNVSFHYQHDHDILKGLSLIIGKGEKIAITGGSGEGKTTILLLLMGFLKAQKGEIVVDGARLQPNDSLAVVGYVAQNPYILNGSIAENIAFGVPSSEIDRKKVVAALQSLRMESVGQYGIDTMIGERGIKLSGGQRQRLAIARALYAGRKLLLLDEVTNQVDAEVESGIMQILDELSENGTTIIFVTHRLAHPDFFNRVLRLEAGKLVEHAVAS
jgi:ATP-binding cassette, subfamily B, bacterial PglK